MLGWAVRLLFVLAGAITSIFVARDALNFSIIQMVVAVLLFTGLVIVLVFWPMLKSWFKRTISKNKHR
jgi:hypothetical protein